MPEISMFYEWIVSMYYLNTKQYKLPHTHIKYGEMESVYQIPDGNMFEDLCLQIKKKLVQARMEIHEEDLMANKELAVTGNKVFSIDPLK